MKRLLWLVLLLPTSIVWAQTEYIGDYAVGSTIEFPFNTFDSAGGSVTITDLAVADIDVYKNGSTTERNCTTGFTLLDTDGVDVDAATGFHGFQIDTSNNCDAGYWVAARYVVNVNAITVDSQTVRFSYVFSLGRMEAVADTVIAAITSNLGNNLTTVAGVTDNSQWTISAGSTQDGAYVNWYALVRDDENPLNVQRCLVNAYVGGTKQVTCRSPAPALFTIEATDIVNLMPAEIASMVAVDPASLATQFADVLSGISDSETAITDELTTIGTTIGTPTNFGSGATLAANIQDLKFVLLCTVDTANFAGSVSTLACDLTDAVGTPVTAANNRLTGIVLEVTSGAQIREQRFINSTTWDAANNELQLTLDRPLPGTLADNVTAIIR